MRPALLILLICLLLAGTVPVSGLSPQQKVYTVVTTAHMTFNPGAVSTIQPTQTTLSMAHLTVTSDPSGAEIWMFGKDQFIATPWSSDVYPSAVLPAPHQQYSIALKYPGYNDYFETFTLDYGQSYTINAKLTPLTTTAPPVTNPPDYNPPTNPQPTIQQIPAPSGTAGSLSSLSSQSPAPGTGSLSVTTNPTGATIEVDGIPAGASPAVIPGLPAGMHNLTITKPGYAVLITQVNIVGGQTMEYSTTLLPATEPTKQKSPGFDAIVAGLAVACIVFVKRPA
jgi:hypothetical protein